jgi:hypothetical protein
MKIINRVTKASFLLIEKYSLAKGQFVQWDGRPTGFGLLYFLFLFGGFPLHSFSQVFIPLKAGHSYTTNFPLTENPISEGGNWVNGGTVGIDWANVSSASGLAIGHEVGVRFSDGTALLTGAWAPDQTAMAVVYSINQDDACYQEVELRLRSSLSANSCKGYEINFKASKTSNAYLQIVRWNGGLGDFSYVDSRSGAQYGVKTGDTVKASIVGNVITAYINGVQMLQATDTVFKRGNPGIGFNLENSPAGCPGTNGNYGFTYFKATDSSLSTGAKLN